MYQITVSDTFAKVMCCFEYQTLDTFGLDSGYEKKIIKPPFFKLSPGLDASPIFFKYDKFLSCQSFRLEMVTMRQRVNESMLRWEKDAEESKVI